MKNLSPSLTVTLADAYLQPAHVRDLGLKSSSDPVVWDYAARLGYTIVTKDADFHQRSFLYGPPPKVIWIRLGNCSTRQIVELLSGRRSQIEAFGQAGEQGFLSLA
jgi:predicted nuclease of predicted toxin-antitoxin system